MYIKTYQQAQRYLESLIPDPEAKRKGNLRLERIRDLLALLRNPEKKYKSVHIGGTSGKGSTAYFVSALLINAGYKVGLHISPHLQVLTERMQVNNRFIKEEKFVSLVNDVQALVEEVEKRGVYGKPSYFEVLVALSFQYFAIEKVDIAIIEVGLGGTLDATNVTHPLVGVVTNVSLDHTQILGNTVEKIARDKAGIIKQGIEVVTSAIQPSILHIIAQRCKKMGARLTTLKPTGLFQEQNTALALAVVKKLEGQGFFVSDEAIQRTLQKARFAGRLEVMQESPLVILDGAHNPAKMKALIVSLQKLFSMMTFTSIVAFKKGKDVKTMLKELLPVTNEFIFTRFHITTDTGGDMSLNPEGIVAILREINSPIPYTIQEKVILPDTPTLITGSLYFVGEMRNRWYPWQAVLEKRSWYP